MNKTTKKIILGTVLVGSVALVTMQTVGARPWGGGYGGQCGECDGSGYGYQQQYDEKSQAAQDKFLADTVELRKDIATKTAEKRALLGNDNPDPARVAQLTGELFELREQLYGKAQEAGIDKVGLRGPGLGRGGCNGPGFGRYQRPL